LRISLTGDDEGALFVFPKEKETKLGGTFMGIGARHRTVVVDGAGML
jgi:hypothetical protein